MCCIPQQDPTCSLNCPEAVSCVAPGVVLRNDAARRKTRDAWAVLQPVICVGRWEGAGPRAGGEAGGSRCGPPVPPPAGPGAQNGPGTNPGIPRTFLPPRFVLCTNYPSASPAFLTPTGPGVSPAFPWHPVCFIRLCKVNIKITLWETSGKNTAERNGKHFFFFARACFRSNPSSFWLCK